jgi:hypothetical protein
MRIRPESRGVGPPWVEETSGSATTLVICRYVMPEE